MTRKLIILADMHPAPEIVLRDDDEVVMCHSGGIGSKRWLVAYVVRTVDDDNGG